MHQRLLDFLFNRGSYDARRRRLFRGAIISNMIFFVVTSGIVVRLWFAIQGSEIWRDYHGRPIGPEELRHDLMFFGAITLLAMVTLGTLIRFWRK